MLPDDGQACTRGQAAFPVLVRGGRIIDVGSEAIAHPRAIFLLHHGSTAGLERSSATPHDEMPPVGMGVATRRAGPMHDEDAGWSIGPELTRRYREETGDKAPRGWRRCRPSCIER